MEKEYIVEKYKKIKVIHNLKKKCGVKLKNSLNRIYKISDKLFKENNVEKCRKLKNQIKLNYDFCY